MEAVLTLLGEHMLPVSLNMVMNMQHMPLLQQTYNARVQRKANDAHKTSIRHACPYGDTYQVHSLHVG